MNILAAIISTIHYSGGPCVDHRGFSHCGGHHGGCSHCGGLGGGDKELGVSMCGGVIMVVWPTPDSLDHESHHGPNNASNCVYTYLSTKKKRWDVKHMYTVTVMQTFCKSIVGTTNPKLS